ncbi:Orotidine 5'-phosphate decarboxylase [Mucisphaera calidilacus]|uniref:Orotidine 5'-phosphate decarboxylase n=2 Tax=Mucisphaera calidilacus TaxID=2527982 RepID=A0A518BXS9_9BACT|nr:Orotidine 5'-phosphate decarboxylase [Mucisphaera calidilacus]
MFGDRLSAAVSACGAPVCVGLDPVLERLPDASGEPLAAVERFCTGVLDAVAGVAPVVKIQSACFERYGWAGVRLLESLIVGGRERGLLVINDAKRGDIAISATHYAKALLSGDAAADALTVNGYLGVDAVEPFVAVAEREGAGLFVLVRTSNPGAETFQGVGIEGGGDVSSAMARMVRGVGAGLVGASGLSSVGAVVGATKPEVAERLRGEMPEQVFLLPGYGAQGGDASGLRRFATERGDGVLVTASRSVIYAGEGAGWREAVRGAAERMRDEVGAALG